MRHVLKTGLWLVLTAALLSAQDRAAPENKNFGADLKDVNLHDLTLAVQRITKKTFLWTENLNLRQVKVHFVSDKSIGDDPELLFKVYQSILQVTDFMLYPAGKEGEEIYKIGLAQTGLKRPVPIRSEDSAPEDRFVTRVFSLKYVVPREVQAALLNMTSFPQAILTIESAGLLLVTDYDYNIRRFEEIIAAMDVKKPDIEMRVVALRHALATDVQQMMDSLVQTLITRSVSRPGAPGMTPGAAGLEAVKVVADKRTNSVILLAEPNRLAQLEEIVQNLDSETPFETSGIYILHLRHTNAVDISKTLNAMYRIGVDDRGVPSGGTGARPGQAVAPTPVMNTATSLGGGSSSTGGEPTIVADVRSNSIIVITDRNTYKTLEEIVERLDQRRPQVLIKATVVEIRASEDFDLGVELNRFEDPTNRTMGAGRSQFGYSTITSDTDNNTFTIVPVDTPGISLLLMRNRIGNIGAMLKALQEKVKVSVLDEPEAATNDNGVAEMKVSNQVPILQTTVTGTGVAQTTFSRFETAETTLTISPHISEGGYLRLETSVKIEKFTKESADATIPPPKTSREITTKEIMVPNGATMVIGGIVTQDKTDTVQGIPLLSDIPLLGAFFRRTQQSDERRTLYIFLTPYILYDYSFGDYGDVSRSREEQMEQLRGEGLRKLSADGDATQLPDSTFRFQSPRYAVREEPPVEE